MSRILLGASVASIMLAASALSPAAAQSTPEGASGAAASIGTLTCGDITGLSETDASALVYYAAGYQDGMRGSPMSDGAMDSDNASADSSSAANSAAGGASDGNPATAAGGESKAGANTPDPAGVAAADKADSSGDAANASADAADAGAGADAAASGGTKVGGLGLQANVIIDACSRTPDALLSEIIADNGGSAGDADAAGSTTPANEDPKPADNEAGAATPK